MPCGIVICTLCHGTFWFQHSCSGENIFNTISSNLRDKNISWQNCIALGSDNAAVMGGKNKGVISFIRSVSSNCYFSGCPCPIIHLPSKYATEVLPIRISDALIDIYYHLKMSAKRQGQLSELQTKHLGNWDKLNVLKHVPTRWLSLLQGVQRLNELWVPLREFFSKKRNSNKKDSQSRPARIYEFLTSRTNRAFCHFLAFILPVFCRANTALQFEKPLIHKSRRICMDLYRCILLKFLKPSAFTGKALLDINVKLLYNLRSDNDIALGEATRVYLLEKNFSDSKQKELCSSVREFYRKAAIYLKEKLEPMNCELLKAVEFCDVTQISGMSFSSVRYVVEKLPPMMPKDCTID